MEYKLGNKVLVGFIILMSAFGPISTDMFLSKLPDMAYYFHTTPETMNMSLYLFMFMMAVSILFLGTLSDKYGRRIILVLSMILYIAMNIFCALTDDITFFLAGRALEGFGAGGALAISTALQKDFFEGEKLGKVITITVALGIMGPIASPVIGSAIIAISDWKWTFIVPAIVGAACLLMALVLPKEIPVDRYSGSVISSITNLGKFLKHRGFTVFLIMISILMCGQLAYVAASSYIYEGKFGFDSTQFSLAMAGLLIIAVMIMITLEHYEKIIGNKTILVMLPAGTILTSVLLFTIGEKEWWLFSLSMLPLTVMSMFGRSFGFNILLNEFDEDNGAVSSLVNFINYMFFCFGMILATATWWTSYISGLGYISLMCACVFIMMWVIFRLTGCRLKVL